MKRFLLFLVFALMTCIANAQPPLLPLLDVSSTLPSTTGSGFLTPSSDTSTVINVIFMDTVNSAFEGGLSVPGATAPTGNHFILPSLNTPGITGGGIQFPAGAGPLVGSFSIGFSSTGTGTTKANAAILFKQNASDPYTVVEGSTVSQTIPLPETTAFSLSGNFVTNPTGPSAATQPQYLYLAVDFFPSEPGNAIQLLGIDISSYIVIRASQPPGSSGGTGL